MTHKSHTGNTDAHLPEAAFAVPCRPLLRRAGSGLALFLSFLLVALSAVHAAEATLNVEIPGESWRSVRLKDLPKGAGMALQVVSTRTIRVILVDSAELLRFPDTQALFDAVADRRLGFSVVIPRDGDYFVVFDNRRAAGTTKVRLRVQAQPPRRDRQPDT